MVNRLLINAKFHFAEYETCGLEAVECIDILCARPFNLLNLGDSKQISDE